MEVKRFENNRERRLGSGGILALDRPVDPKSFNKKFSNLFTSLGYYGVMFEVSKVEDIEAIMRMEGIEENRDHIFFKFSFHNVRDKMDKKMVKRMIRRSRSRLDRLRVRYSLSIGEELLDILNLNEIRSLGIRILKLQRIPWTLINKVRSHKVYFEVSLKRLAVDESYRRDVYHKLHFLEEGGKLLFSQNTPFIPSKFVPFIVNILTYKRLYSYGPVMRWWDTLC